MAETIQDILGGTDPKIVRRGADYYDQNRICRLEWIKPGLCRAEVEGQCRDSYHVELRFSEEGNVLGWHCDCPYTYGDLCKHVAAVLLAIQNGDCPEPETGGRKVRTRSC